MAKPRPSYSTRFHFEVFILASWPKADWLIYPEKHAKRWLTEHQKRDWAALQEEIHANRQAWDTRDKRKRVPVGELIQLLWWSSCLNKRFYSLLFGEEIDEIANFLYAVRQGEKAGQLPSDEDITTPPTLH